MDCKSPIRVVPQKADADCGVACLAMLLGFTYEDVYVEVAKIDRRRSRRGLYMSQIKRVALALGKPLAYKRKYDPEDVTGILAVDLDGFGHVVVLWQGIVIETDGSLWEYDDYLVVNQAEARSLLILKE